MVIAKNVTTFDINLEDMGFTISALSTVNLTDIFSLNDVTESNDLKTNVENENIIINDGVKDLGKEDGLYHITYETAYEDMKEISICQVYDISGTTNCNSGVNFPFDAESFKDSNYEHSNVNSPDKIIVKSKGVYKIFYNISHINKNNVRKNIRTFCVINDTIMINPSLSYSYSRNKANPYATNSAYFFVFLNSGDYITVVCEQAGESGSTISEAEACWLTIEKIRNG